MPAIVTCQDCGAKIELRDNLRFCPECGVSLRDEPEDESDVDEADDEDE